jgi:hypothetical protein
VAAAQCSDRNLVVSAVQLPNHVYRYVGLCRQGRTAASTTRTERTGSTIRTLSAAKVDEVRRRGSNVSGQYATTRRNVFAGDADVWLGVGTMTSNAVWVAPSHHHVVASISEGGALQWGKNVNGCLGPVEELVKEDPEMYDTPAVCDHFVMMVMWLCRDSGKRACYSIQLSALCFMGCRHLRERRCRS